MHPHVEKGRIRGGILGTFKDSNAPDGEWRRSDVNFWGMGDTAVVWTAECSGQGSIEMTLSTAVVPHKLDAHIPCFTMHSIIHRSSTFISSVLDLPDTITAVQYASNLTSPRLPHSANRKERRIKTLCYLLLCVRDVIKQKMHRHAKQGTTRPPRSTQPIPAPLPPRALRCPWSTTLPRSLAAGGSVPPTGQPCLCPNAAACRCCVPAAQ